MRSPSRCSWFERSLTCSGSLTPNNWLTFSKFLLNSSLRSWKIGVSIMWKRCSCALWSNKLLNTSNQWWARVRQRGQEPEWPYRLTTVSLIDVVHSWNVHGAGWVDDIMMSSVDKICLVLSWPSTILPSLSIGCFVPNKAVITRIKQIYSFSCYPV